MLRVMRNTHSEVRPHTRHLACVGGENKGVTGEFPPSQKSFGVKSRKGVYRCIQLLSFSVSGCFALGVQQRELVVFRLRGQLREQLREQRPEQLGLSFRRFFVGRLLGGLVSFSPEKVLLTCGSIGKHFMCVYNLFIKVERYVLLPGFNL